ncbi:GNAT family N-acetyltransferase [Paenibacillus sp. GSMTC-2017]|uniref:GNAT family N-acetyltransferase n=1 Tax=Paenibacillus sp. GSMTC-2017 TaxID=2794350 RepID=UPI0018D64B1A|nr:GNAT family N-acetyltransferase [Paenibacillus sp. GSMTC-2017]MBH5316266.1 GNAT family N-acetyltransferase [Paenibacillus sp. GSMTC-2017]
MYLNTERLTIRKFHSSDWQAVFDYTSDSNVMRYIPEGVFTEQDAKDFVNKNSGEHATKYAVILNETNILIGHMAFHSWYGEIAYEVGWVFHPDYYNNGYATEATRAIVKYAFEILNIHRIIATCQPQNIPSYRIMEKVGMKKEAHFKKCIPANFIMGTEWWDEYLYAILKEEWIS